MGKKSKKDKPKKVKDRSKVDERLKKINQLQAPENPDKLEDEASIERFWRFGLRKGGNSRETIKQKNRSAKRERRYL